MAHRLTYLIKGGQHLIGHVVLEHPRRDEHLVKGRVVGPDGLVDGLVFVQDLPAMEARGTWNEMMKGMMLGHVSYRTTREIDKLLRNHHPRERTTTMSSISGCYEKSKVTNHANSGGEGKHRPSQLLLDSPIYSPPPPTMGLPALLINHNWTHSIPTRTTPSGNAVEIHTQTGGNTNLLPTTP